MKKFKKAVPVTDLHDEIIREASLQMSKSIDFTILSDIMVESGWTKIVINYVSPTHSWVDIKDWVDQNCTDEHQEHMGIWLFKNKKDAIIFSLKWT